MKILVIEPYYAGSHKQWLDSLQKYSSHDISCITLPGRHWKWRMQGGAISCAKEFHNNDIQPDLIVCSDMLNLSAFAALSRDKIKDTPILLYFHENQFGYPINEKDSDHVEKRDRHYAFINYNSALCADYVSFNSKFHRQSFFENAKRYLSELPDQKNLELINKIEQRSNVLYPGIEPVEKKESVKNELVHILWNHRWEYDKNYEGFIALLREIKKRKKKFKLIISGQNFDDKNNSQSELLDEFKDEIYWCGYCESADHYKDLLRKADLLPVTSHHDFFGVSVVEAIDAGVFPVLPNRLAYLEHVSDTYLYENEDDLLNRCIDFIDKFDSNRNREERLDVSNYYWKSIIVKYDQHFENMKEINSSLF